MENQILTAPYVTHIPISFEFFKDQSPRESSVGKWTIHPSRQPEAYFKVPQTMQLKLIDIKQTELLQINLLFGYRINGLPGNEVFNANTAYIFNNPSKATPPVITADISNTIEFIAYPIGTVKTAITEVVNAIFLISPVSQHLVATQ